VSRVEIVIDELVVRGLGPEAARAAADELERRLTALAGEADEAIRPRDEAFRRLPDVATGESSVGDAVAAALWSALAPGRRGGP
jgi:hypothetical protein